MFSNADYFVPTGFVTAEIEEKKSRFVTAVTSVSTKKEATLFFQQARNIHPTANHHCTVFIIGNPKCATDQGWNDDGEPSGTAGKPMLNILQHNNIGNVAAVVTRFFGGVKLGTGGLVRAYSGALKAALEVLGLQGFFPTTAIKISFHYQFETAIRNLIEEATATLKDAQYSTLVSFEIELAEQKVSDFQVRVLDLTRGAAIFK